MQEKLGNVLSFARGLHILPEEKDPKNLQNSNISKAYLLNYDDIQSYKEELDVTLDVNWDKKTEVYVNLDKRYKNSRPANLDIIIPQRSFYIEPRLICLNKNDKHNYIYSNDVIFIRNISNERVDMFFILYLLRTQKMMDIINKPLEKMSRRSTLENIEIELPDIATQREITEELKKAQKKFDDLIK